MSELPDLKANHQGLEVLLVFEQNIGEALQFSSNNNYHDKAMHLA